MWNVIIWDVTPHSRVCSSESKKINTILIYRICISTFEKHIKGKEFKIVYE